jgi:predicted phage terminase large subunit-like protein
MARRSIDQQRSGDIDAVRARCSSLAGFVREAWPVVLPETPYVHGWHIEMLCRHLEAVTRDEFLAKGLDNRLLINIPPGTGKSLLLGVFFPAFEWGPCGLSHLQYIATSYREDNCYRDARRFRTLVSSEWYQRLWGDRVKLTKTGEGHIECAASGWRMTIPFGSLTASRADRLLIDDPHSIDTAESDADRDRTTMRFRESATTRLNDPVRSAILVIMQRLHERDVSGVILAMKLRYVHVMLPMRFEPERACVTPFGRDLRTADGELLFPERFPEAAVDRDEATMGTHAVSGQHQQRPSPRGGLMFKRHWFKVVPAAPADCRWVRGWDLAGSVKRTSAYTAGVKVGFCRADSKFYIAHVARDRVENPQAMIVNTASADGKSVEISLPQDPGAAGAIQARSLVAALVGYRVTATPESGEKADRAIPVQSQAEAGNVAVVDGPWNEAFLNELACLDETAIVTTAQGDKPIAQVTTDDWVMTRLGWRRVLQSGCTGTKRICEIGFSNGRRLRTTFDHQIFRPGYGFKKAEMLREGESLLRFTGTSSIVGSKAVDRTFPAAALAEVRGFSYIVPFTKTKLVLFLQDVISTIETAIRQTIASRTFNVSPLPNIGSLGVIDLNEGASNAVNPSMRQVHATNIVRRAAGGMLTQIFDCVGTNASNAANCSEPIIGMPNSAASLVLRLLTGKTLLTTSISASNRNGATGAGKSSSLKFDTNNFAADVVVSSIRMLSGVHRVYNLQVNEMPEYVANGVLVHNCFPSGAYKDQVDAMSRAFSRFVLTPNTRIIAPIIVTQPLMIHGSFEE